MTKILTCRQAWWSEYLSSFNLVICFHPGKLRTKPNALTRQWHIYLKEGIATMPVSIHRLLPVFNSEQLASSVQATILSIQSSVDLSSWIMKGSIPTFSLNSKRNPFPQNTSTISQNPQWTSIPMVYSTTSDASILLNSGNIRLCVLPYSHNHPLQVILVRWRPFIKSACKTLVQNSSLGQELLQVMHHLLPFQTMCHTPYGLLKQLPIPKLLPLEFHIHGFHRESPSIFQLPLILVIVDCLQSSHSHSDSRLPSCHLNFTIFVLHVFSKHSEPNHITFQS